jgi:8-oxo-dGTP diphosphatase
MRGEPVFERDDRLPERFDNAQLLAAPRGDRPGFCHDWSISSIVCYNQFSVDMERLLTLSESDVGLPQHEHQGSWRERLSVKAVLVNVMGGVALLHASLNHYHKLPGGGVKDGESEHDALHRELREELGSTGVILGEVGEVVEVRHYRGLRQVSRAYVVRHLVQVGPPMLTENEQAEGFETLWARDIDAAIRAVSLDPVDEHNYGRSFRKVREQAILEAAKEAYGL